MGGWRKSARTFCAAGSICIIKHTEELAPLLTAEQGKPLAEARGEIAYGAGFIEFFAEEAKRVYGETIAIAFGRMRASSFSSSRSAFAAITPWNFPAAMITRKVAPALAAGARWSCKPAARDAALGARAGGAGQQAGVPKGVFNVITGKAGCVGDELTTNPSVRAITFTGSTEVGKQLMRQAASTVKKVGAGTRRQRALHRVRRRRSRHGGRRRYRLQIPQHGPDLRLRQSRFRAGRRL